MNWVKNFIRTKKGQLTLFLLILLIWGVADSYLAKDKPKEVSFTSFEKELAKDKIDEVFIDFNGATFTFTKDDKKATVYQTDNPREEGFKKSLLHKEVEVNEVVKKSQAKNLLFFALQMLIIVGLLTFFMKSSTGGKFKIKQAGKKSETPSLKFHSIAGNEEAKEEMELLVSILKEPKKFADKGAKVPKGVVFYGEPGTGKTLMAKAIAGEAEVPFFTMNGSDFIEKYVGVGASRVRSLFTKARKNAPCIVFIDEIDAIGKKRGSAGNSEQDQTINALLDELDGFGDDSGIIVISATNRLDTLDEALIRPGRFDKHIAIRLPEQKDRESILTLHAKNKKISKDVSFQEVSKMTIGFAGAGLETLLNEATILSVNRNSDEVEMKDIDSAFYRMVMKGSQKKNQKNRQTEELELVAWHEAGHAMIAKLKTTNDVPKVTIISSTSGAGGVTFMTPKKMGLFSKSDLEGEIKTLYAGRIAELLLLGSDELVTTGAQQDIQQATEKIHQYINSYGMSNKFGMIDASKFNAEKEILEEAINISKRLYNETYKFMLDNKELLEAISLSLLEKETIKEEELEEIIQNYQEHSVA